MSNNKICGECQYLYTPDWTKCLLDGSHIVWDKPACERFKQKLRDTYGDQIRAMSDYELADFLIYPVSSDYALTDDGVVTWTNWSSLGTQCFYKSKQEAFEKTLEKLKKEVNR